MYFARRRHYRRLAVRSAEILQGMLPEEALHAIRAHNHEYSGTPPATPLDYALIATDAMSGLVVATALVMPSRQLGEVRVDSILKKYGDGSFARTIDRGRIRQCEQLGLSLEEFSHTQWFRHKLEKICSNSKGKERQLRKYIPS